MARKAAIIGGRVIGGGWAARLLSNGWDFGILATNALARAATIIENTGARVIPPAEVRARLKLAKRAPVAK